MIGLRRIGIWMLAAVIVGGCAQKTGQPPSAAMKKKLNVLLILSDDLCADLGCYGAPVKSPNVDALASTGVRFNHIYCQYPLCGPSRCSFMSGLRPDTTDVLNNGLPVRHKLKDVVTLPQLFRNNGYFSARCGKVYHLGIPNQVGQSGPDDPASWDYIFNPKGAEYDTDGEEFDPTPANGQGFRRVMGKGEGLEQADYESADEAIRILNAKKDKPFFLAVGFIRPHVPEIAPKKYFDLYDINQIHMPYNPPGDRENHPAAEYRGTKVNFGMNEKDCVESIRAYHATTSFMDAQAGRVLDELDHLGLRDSTIVIFMSDHGYLLGQHQAWQKMMLFEEACRVPMIISTPTLRHRGATAEGLAESIDMYPTVAQLAGLTPPKELQGRSLVPLLNDPSGDFKNAVFTQLQYRQTEGRSVRTSRWRYTEWNGGNKGVELYDHANDPREFTNLAKDPAQAQTLKELHQLLASGKP